MTGFFTCDYPDSTKEDTYPESLENNSFYGPGCFSLPVVWKSFNVNLNENELNQLVWEISKEIGSSHYEIERAIWGAQNFKTIGNVGMALDRWLQKVAKGVCLLELVYGRQVYRIKILQVYVPGIFFCREKKYLNPSNHKNPTFGKVCFVNQVVEIIFYSKKWFCNK